MFLPFQSKTNSNDNNTNNPNNGEPLRVLTEEEQILLAVDQGVHEVNE